MQTSTTQGRIVVSIWFENDLTAQVALFLTNTIHVLLHFKVPNPLLHFLFLDNIEKFKNKLC